MARPGRFGLQLVELGLQRIEQQLQLFGGHGVDAAAASAVHRRGRTIAQEIQPDDDYEAASAQFNDKELADLTYAIGLMNAFNRLGVTFRNTPAAVRKATSGQ